MNTALIVGAGLLLALGIQTVRLADEQAEVARMQTSIERTRAEAATQLAAETGKTLAAERRLREQSNEQERLDATHQQTVAGLERQLHDRGGPSLRLRDPNAAPDRCLGGGPADPVAAAAAPGAADAAETGGLFSAGATRLFERLTREADDINIAYASCRADAAAVRAIPMQ